MSDELDLIDQPDDESRGKRALRYVRDWGIALGVAVIAFLAFDAYRAPDVPDVAPDFTLQTLDGDTVSLSELRGQTVVLNFWATWCGPCRQEIPAFSAWSLEHPDVPVLGIATDDSPAKLRAARKQLDIAYPIVLGDAQVARDYDVSSLPTTVIVGPDGHVQDVHVGIMMGWQLDLATR